MAFLDNYYLKRTSLPALIWWSKTAFGKYLHIVRGSQVSYLQDACLLRIISSRSMLKERMELVELANTFLERPAQKKRLNLVNSWSSQLCIRTYQIVVQEKKVYKKHRKSFILLQLWNWTHYFFPFHNVYSLRTQQQQYLSLQFFW